MINPADADARGIEADSLVTVTSRTGEIQMPVIITDDIMPGVVCMPHLWGHNRKNTRQRVANANPGVSMNDITDVTGIDKLTGNAIVNGVPVKVEAVDKVSSKEITPEDETVEEYVA
jgi:anaerobic selenocysteine-containing dehydrogenase